MKQQVSALGRRVDLNLMVVFEAIYRTRNLTAAGEGLGLSQPAMSHALSRLRWTFGDPLFLRVPRGLEPTALADEVAPFVTQGIATIRRGFERKAFDPAVSTRLFTIAMSDIGEVAHLPSILAALGGAPGVRVRTVEMSPTEARAALADGRVDVALAVNMRPAAPFRDALIVEHGYATVARVGHPVIRSRLTAGQFRKARHLLVMPTGPVTHGEVIERALRGVDAQIAVQVAHFHPVAAIVGRSDLIATVPRGLAETMPRDRIRVFDPPIPLPRVRVSLCWHERYDKDPGNAWLRELYLRATGPVHAAKGRRRAAEV
jgi:DNA-binding transcriptional LysR family regulator